MLQEKVFQRYVTMENLETVIQGAAHSCEHDEIEEYCHGRCCTSCEHEKLGENAQEKILQIAVNMKELKNVAM